MSEHKELGLAFSKVMRELAGISFKKDAFNGGKKNNYITLDAINSHLLPILRSNDLCFIVHRDADQNFWGTLTYLPTLQEYSKCFGLIDLNHTGKKSDGSEYELMNTAQAQGATLSYGRRYVTTCFFNLLVDNDTDGEIGYKNQGSYSSSRTPSTQPQSQPSSSQGYQAKEGFEKTLTGSFQVKDIALGNLTKAGDKRHAVLILMDGRKWECYPELLSPQKQNRSEWDLKLEALKKLIYFNKGVNIKLGLNFQRACGITNDEIKLNLTEKAHKEGSTIAFQEEQKAINSDENIPF